MSAQASRTSAGLWQSVTTAAVAARPANPQSSSEDRRLAVRSFFLEAASAVGLGVVSAGEAVRGAGLAAFGSGFAGSDLDGSAFLAGSVLAAGAGSILGASALAGAEAIEAVAGFSPLWEAKMLLVLPLVELTSMVPVPAPRATAPMLQRTHRTVVMRMGFCLFCQP